MRKHLGRFAFQELACQVTIFVRGIPGVSNELSAFQNLNVSRFLLDYWTLEWFPAHIHDPLAIAAKQINVDIRNITYENKKLRR